MHNGGGRKRFERVIKGRHEKKLQGNRSELQNYFFFKNLYES